MQATATPARLQHHYMVVEAEKKLEMLWSFVKAHLKEKTIVFCSSCKQVQFIHGVFSALRPGAAARAPPASAAAQLPGPPPHPPPQPACQPACQPCWSWRLWLRVVLRAARVPWEEAARRPVRGCGAAVRPGHRPLIPTPLHLQARRCCACTAVRSR